MFYIRADANQTIASGHMMRCIAIGKELEKMGIQVAFLCAQMEGVVFGEKYGFTCHCLQTAYNHLDTETDSIVEYLKPKKAEGILVDSYFVTEKYLHTLNQVAKVAYIDDLDKMQYPVDLLIQYGDSTQEKKVYYNEKYQQTNTKLLLGHKYIPLREEFQSVGSEQRNGSVLLTTGASDPYNIQVEFLTYLRDNEKSFFEKINFDVIVGKFHKYEKELEELAIYHKNIRIHKDVVEMAEYMRKASVCISAGGTTLFELCACGTPTVSFTFADNQIAGAEYLYKEGLVYYGGDVREGRKILFQKIQRKVKELITNSKLQIELSKKMQYHVDGQGARRIAQEIKTLIL